MSQSADCYRNLLIRAITGERPALVVHVADNKVLTDLCEQLACAERVGELLQHNGLSKAGDPIDKTIAALLKKERT